MSFEEETSKARRAETIPFGVTLKPSRFGRTRSNMALASGKLSRYS